MVEASKRNPIYIYFIILDLIKIHLLLLEIWIISSYEEVYCLSILYNMLDKSNS